MRVARSLFFISMCIFGLEGKLKKYSPPHCTQITKDSDYASRYKMDYPVAYIHPGQREAYQQLFCVNPAAVNKGVAVACDWAAPPQVQFALGDEFLHVLRQDPAGVFPGNAVIKTYQLCNHTTHLHDAANMAVIEIEDWSQV